MPSTVRPRMAMMTMAGYLEQLANAWPRGMGDGLAVGCSHAIVPGGKGIADARDLPADGSTPDQTPGENITHGAAPTPFHGGRDVRHRGGRSRDG